MKNNHITNYFVNHFFGFQNSNDKKCFENHLPDLYIHFQWQFFAGKKYRNTNDNRIGTIMNIENIFQR